MSDNKDVGTHAPTFTERFATRGIALGERYLKLGDWILAHRYQISTVTARELFKELGVYSYDLARFAKFLGFSGWKELKESLHKETIERLEYLDTEEGLAEAARRLYRAAKHKKVSFGCPFCDYQHIFRAKGGWYQWINNGLAEPKIRFCPHCGHKLTARSKKAG